MDKICQYFQYVRQHSTGKSLWPPFLLSVGFLVGDSLKSDRLNAEDMMSIIIDLSAELEQELVRRAEIVGMDVPSLVQELLTERLGIAAPKKTYEEARAAFDRIAARHQGTEGFVDDSRESIYAGRE